MDGAIAERHDRVWLRFVKSADSAGGKMGRIGFVFSRLDWLTTEPIGFVLGNWLALPLADWLRYFFPGQDSAELAGSCPRCRLG
jgi:hypothetical protein